MPINVQSCIHKKALFNSLSIKNILTVKCKTVVTVIIFTCSYKSFAVCHQFTKKT